MTAHYSKGNSNEMDLQIALIPKIPIAKFHGEPLNFISMPGITQEEYEHAVLNKE